MFRITYNLGTSLTISNCLFSDTPGALCSTSATAYDEKVVIVHCRFVGVDVTSSTARISYRAMDLLENFVDMNTFMSSVSSNCYYVLALTEPFSEPLKEISSSYSLPTINAFSSPETGVWSKTVGFSETAILSESRTFQQTSTLWYTRDMTETDQMIVTRTFEGSNFIVDTQSFSNSAHLTKTEGQSETVFSSKEEISALESNELSETKILISSNEPVPVDSDQSSFVGDLPGIPSDMSDLWNTDSASPSTDSVGKRSEELGESEAKTEGDDNDDDDGLSTGAIVGIAVGSVAVVGGVCALGYALGSDNSAVDAEDGIPEREEGGDGRADDHGKEGEANEGDEVGKEDEVKHERTDVQNEEIDSDASVQLDSG
jgi:hypothetical protein